MKQLKREMESNMIAYLHVNYYMDEQWVRQMLRKLNQYERFDQWGLSYDKNGNLTQRGTQHFTYDYKNKIVKATDVNSTINFKYDALGRRIKKEVTISSQSKTTFNLKHSNAPTPGFPSFKSPLRLFVF